MAASDGGCETASLGKVMLLGLPLVDEAGEKGTASRTLRRGGAATNTPGFIFEHCFQRKLFQLLTIRQASL